MDDDQIVGELQCPVCLELYTWPIILPCSHILCRDPCAERLFAHGFIKCPVCRDNSFVSGGIQNLPRVISIEHIIDHIRNQVQRPESPSAASSCRDDDDDDGVRLCGPDDVACQLCDVSARRPARRAVKSCLHCNASYCDLCLKASHPNRAPFTDHRLIEPRHQRKPEERLRCLQHDAMINAFCIECQTLMGCLLCAEDQLNAHAGHRIVSSTQAADSLKGLLEEGLKTVEKNHSMVAESIACCQTMLTDLQHGVDERKSIINCHCDSLVNEIEIKRDFFLSDLEYEERSKRDCLTENVESLRLMENELRSLLHYTSAALRETDPSTFIQLAKSITDKIAKHHSTVPAPMSAKLCHKTIDFRKEKTILRDLTYLIVPDTPQIDVTKCSRSTSSVVLVLSVPTQDGDVIDGFRVFFSTDQVEPLQSWEVVDFKTPGEARRCGRNLPNDSSAVCLMHNNLSSDTTYYFTVLAYNAAGESEMSEVVHCHTLSSSSSHSVLPVPSIIESLCHTYTYSIQLHSPSPLNSPTTAAATTSPSQPRNEAAFYLLYREASVNKIWKSISLYGRVDHRVFGLEPDTLYDFVIMACEKNSECQVSNMVTLRTERSAY